MYAKAVMTVFKKFSQQEKPPNAINSLQECRHETHIITYHHIVPSFSRCC